MREWTLITNHMRQFISHTALSLLATTSTDPCVEFTLIQSIPNSTRDCVDVPWTQRDVFCTLSLAHRCAPRRLSSWLMRFHGRSPPRERSTLASHSRTHSDHTLESTQLSTATTFVSTGARQRTCTHAHTHTHTAVGGTLVSGQGVLMCARAQRVDKTGGTRR